MPTAAAAAAAINDARWRIGHLRWKLDPTQQAVLAARDAAWASPGTIVRPWYFVLSHRGYGKTFMAICAAFEACLQKKNARVLYIAPDGGTDASNMFRDVAEAYILNDCPADVRPKYNPQDNCYTFPTTGALLRFRGLNAEKREKLRGFGANEVFMDEVGLVDELRYVVNSILMPVAVRLKGHLTMVTTIPRTPQHESMSIYDECAADGLAHSVTLRENTRLEWNDKALALVGCGESRADVPAILAGEKNPITVQARREYFNERISDASQMVIPEWTDAARRDALRMLPVGPSDHPPYRDCYTFMDPGFKDRTGILFGYLDYVRQKFVVEHAEALSRPGTQEIADAIMSVEHRLWGYKRPYLRVSDVDPRLQRDLAVEHGLEFAQADKKGRMVDRITYVRQVIASKRLELLSGAALLDDDLRSAVWNSTAKDFERTAAGHSDLVAALMYGLPAIDWMHDPFPRGWFDAPADVVQKHLRDIRRQEEGAKLLPDTPFARRLLESQKRHR